MLRLFVLVMCGTVLAVSGSSAECIVVHRTTAERLEAAPLVFAADVLEVEAVILDPEPFVYRVHFRVLEAYKGTSAGDQIIDFGVTPESYSFKTGQRVLVYASSDGRAKFSTQCTNTRQVQLEEPELSELRKRSVAFGSVGPKKQ